MSSLEDEPMIGPMPQHEWDFLEGDAFYGAAEDARQAGDLQRAIRLYSSATEAYKRVVADRSEVAINYAQAVTRMIKGE